MPPTIVLGRVRTMDPSRPAAEAVAWERGRITVVGSRAEVVAATPGAEVIDLGDVDVLPGFVDAHHHVAIAALYGGVVRLEAPRVADLASLRAAIAEEAARTPEGRWVIATGWDEARLAERRAPTREDLDAAAPGRAVFAMHWSCHRGVASSRALELAGVGRTTPDPPGGVIERDRRGHPTGLLLERAMGRVESLARADRADLDGPGALARITAHLRDVARAGITRVCDAAVPRDLVPLFRDLDARGELPIPVHLCPVSTRGWLDDAADALDGLEPGARLGARVHVGPVKLVFDGAPTCSMCLSWRQTLVVAARTLALAARDADLEAVRTSLAVAPRFGRDVRSGVTIFGAEEAARVVARLVDRGSAVATHAFGNAAIDVALAAYEAVGARLGVGGAPRFEHAAFAEREQARRMAALGAAAVVQPAMVELPMMRTAPAVPGLPFMPLRRLLDAGVRVASSSDYPVEGFDPLAAIRAAVTRETARGEVIDPEERVSLDEAIAMGTREGAAVLGCLDETGTLEAGKRADVVAVRGLGGRDARVVATWVEGARA
jgi:hypothetical protein